MIWPAVVAAALQLIGQVGRGEVFTTGRGSSVVMTFTAGRRGTPVGAIMTAALVYALFVIVIPLSVVLIGATIGGPAGAVGLLGATVYLLAIVAGPLLAAGGRGGARPAVLPRRSSGGPVVRLHDLVRDPREPAGTGVALLHAVIRDPRFDSAAIITTAASSRLADAYQAAGMTPIPGTPTLYRGPRIQQAGVLH